MVLVSKCQEINKFERIHPSRLDPNHQIFLNWGEDYLSWQNKHISHYSSPKLITDSAMLSFELLDDESWLIVPLSVAYTLSTKFSIPFIRFEEEAPKRTIFMISNKNPLYSHRDSIQDFKQLFSVFMNEHSM